MDTTRDSASFRELSSFKIELKYLHLPSNLVISIFTFIDNVLELNKLRTTDSNIFADK